jgi:predicted enzyme related to lactoylglutathione lyase
MAKPVVHFEIGCTDTARAGQFYAALFGWRTAQMGPALTIQTGSERGIPGHFTALGHEPHHYTIFYVEVEDIAAHLTQVQELGGKVVVPKVDVPNYGSFAWFADPEGNTIGLWTPAKPPA